MLNQHILGNNNDNNGEGNNDGNNGQGDNSVNTRIKNQHTGSLNCRSLMPNFPSRIQPQPDNEPTQNEFQDQILQAWRGVSANF